MAKKKKPQVKKVVKPVKGKKPGKKKTKAKSGNKTRSTGKSRKKPKGKASKPVKGAKKKSAPKNKKGKPGKGRTGKGKTKRGKKYFKPTGNLKFFARVKHVIWEKYSGDFKNYQQLVRNDRDENGKSIPFTSVAGKVYLQCRDAQCPDEEILRIYETIRGEGKKDLKPEILPEYQTTKKGFCNYWDLLSDAYWNHLPNYVWVVSPKLIGPGVAFLGIMGADRPKEGNIIEKGKELVAGQQKLFRKFVDYLNELQKLRRNKYGYAIYGEPYWNNKENRWEVEVKPVDKDDKPYDYGFKPALKQQEIPDKPLDTVGDEGPFAGKPGGEDVIKKTPADDKGIERVKLELELEKQKTKTLEAKAEAEKAEAVRIILDQMSKGILSKQEAKEMLSYLKK